MHRTIGLTSYNRIPNPKPNSNPNLSPFVHFSPIVLCIINRDRRRTTVSRSTFCISCYQVTERASCCVRSKDKEITVKEKTEGETLLKPAKEIEQLVMKFNVINDGPGLMPRVDVQVLLPHINDSFGLVASQTVTVSHHQQISLWMIQLLYVIFFFFGMSANFNKLKAPALEVG